MYVNSPGGSVTAGNVDRLFHWKLRLVYFYLLTTDLLGSM